MPAVGADAAAGKAAVSCLDDSRVDYQVARTTSVTRQEAPGTNSHNEEREDGGVDAANRCGRFPAAPCERPGVTRPPPASGNDFRIAVTRRHPAAR